MAKEQGYQHDKLQMVNISFYTVINSLYIHVIIILLRSIIRKWDQFPYIKIVTPLFPEYNCEIILYSLMNSLKFALSTQDSQGKQKEKREVNGSLLKGVNKSKSEALWALDIDNNDRVTEESMDSDQLMRILNDKLEVAFKKDSKNINEVTFERIIEEFQDEAGSSKSQLTYLMLMEDKLTDISEFARPEIKSFLDSFGEMLQDKITKMRKKQKKAQLSNFDNIVNSNFKKKSEQVSYLIVQQQKPRDKEKHSKSPRKASGSNDNKLNRLFSKQKNPLKQRQLKESARKTEEESPYNATTNPNQDQSVSFSAVLGTNLTVKTRKRKASNDYKKQKPKKVEQKTGQKQQGDEAFMFYRPKKGKK